MLLLLTWLYLGLMSKEFFARRWLKARPITYMVTHMAIMPLVDLYTTSCDWVPAGFVRPPPGLLWFLLVSFFNGMVVEIGRKIRSPQDEESGVETYSFLWGRLNAILAWLGMLACTAGFAYVAADPAIGVYGGGLDRVLDRRSNTADFRGQLDRLRLSGDGGRVSFALQLGGQGDVHARKDSKNCYFWLRRRSEREADRRRQEGHQRDARLAAVGAGWLAHSPVVRDRAISVHCQFDHCRSDREASQGACMRATRTAELSTAVA